MIFGGNNNKDQKFFDYLRDAVENASAVAKHMEQLLANPARYAEIAPVVKQLESKGDHLTKDLFTLLHKSFMTPLEREDIAALAVRIDSVVDLMEAVAARIAIYQIKESDRFLKEFAQLLAFQTAELVGAIDLVAGKKMLPIRERTAKIVQLEEQGDEVLRGGLQAIFEVGATNPVRFITMKEIYETLEEATDKAKEVAVTLEGIVMKQG